MLNSFDILGETEIIYFKAFEVKIKERFRATIFQSAETVHLVQQSWYGRNFKNAIYNECVYSLYSHCLIYDSPSGG